MKTKIFCATMEPATVLLFTSMTCPHCPQAKQALERVKEQRDDAEIHNLMTHNPQAQQLAKRFNVMSVPTFIIYGPGHESPMGLVGGQADETLHKYIDIAIGKKEELQTTPKKSSFLKKILQK